MNYIFCTKFVLFLNCNWLSWYEKCKYHMQTAADESQSLLHLTIGYTGRFFMLKSRNHIVI